MRARTSHCANQSRPTVQAVQQHCDACCERQFRFVKWAKIFRPYRFYWESSLLAVENSVGVASSPSPTHRKASMNSPILTLITVLAIGSSVLGQGPAVPLRLSPVQVEDASQSSSPDDSPSLSRPAPEPLRLPEDDSEPVAQPGGREGDVTASQLARLDKPLSQIRLSGLASPPQVSQPGFTPPQVVWMTADGVGPDHPFDSTTTYTRRRLYFEDAPLERCGETEWIFSDGIMTNLHSGAKFLLDTALLPYRLIRQRPDELVGAVAE